MDKQQTERVAGIFDEVMDGIRTWADAYREAMAPVINALSGYRIEESELLERDQIVQMPGVMVMHPWTALRAQYPAGIDGDFATALAWVERTGDRMQARAEKRLERMVKLGRRRDLLWEDIHNQLTSISPAERANLQALVENAAIEWIDHPDRWISRNRLAIEIERLIPWPFSPGALLAFQGGQLGKWAGVSELTQER
jgi:hypothetical protein